MFRKILACCLVVVIVLCIASIVLPQFIRIGGEQTNPAVVKEPAWDSQKTKELAKRACYDCHSNETVWPWYTNILPISLLVQNDVIEGRSKLNFSECGVLRSSGGEEGEEGGDSAEAVLSGFMPPNQYLLIHPSARLTAAERQALALGLINSPCQ